MNKVLLYLVLSVWCIPAFAQECIVLLHGMARSADSMKTMAKELEAEGYQVVNYDYPSTSFEIAELANVHVPLALAHCENTDTVNFVTHSLGGIIVRQYLSTHTLDNLGRVVMLAPPNQGSEVVDTLRDIPVFEWINGPAGLQLGTEDESVPNTLGPVSYPVGVIAGSSTMNPLLSLMLPNPDDGKVSVERTKVKGMSDHIVLPVTHTFLMNDQAVIKQVKAFLETGKFEIKSQL
ncbi:alpha/beta fold hydrolase [Vibrio sp. T187]|uniref:esterase/lipase family protein n=1 Tax=Vibrio TaxID=662 RepID=UPI0010C94607|nr:MULTISPECIES: alpha/beta fold hydrolase [Vibrio]MBW3696003.1 alpha/beta fold hydrolase [Vibrio sp. T187]